MALKTAVAIAVALLATNSDARGMRDWKEDGNTFACGYAKTSPKPKPGTKFGQPGSVQGLPIPVYEKPGDRSPKFVISGDETVPLLAVEKKRIWLKVTGSHASEPRFKHSEPVGFVKERDLEWGALHNCS